MLQVATPESVGISSKVVKKFIEKIEKRGLASHSMLFVRGDKIFGEAYWKPFHKDFLHRMYSQTKSYVSVAIGLLEEEGKLIWECPNCKNRDQDKMNVARRTCGYIGTQYWNQGRTQEIKERVLHL